MTSGIKCHPSCITAFDQLKLRRTHRYILYHINDDEEIQILSRADRDATYGDFVNDLALAMQQGQARYAVYDFECPGKLPALMFIVWTPTNLNVRTKMIYAASRDALRSKLVGIKHSFEAHDLDEITEEELGKRARKEE